jgi:ribosome-binding factor A
MKFRKNRGGPLPPDLDEAFLRALQGDRRTKRSAKPDHKTQQLCRQVQRALALALAGECDDDILREVLVDSVAPAAGASTLIIHIAIPSRIPASTVIARLENVKGFLRARIAESITRKRVPELVFIPIAQEGRHE